MWRVALLLLRFLTYVVSSSVLRDDGGNGVPSNAASREQYFEYDEDLAMLSVIYSSAAYDLNPSVANWTFVNSDCNNKTENFIVNETYVGQGTEAFGYIGLDPVEKRIVVAFKGTSDLRDWITDLRTWLTYNKRCAPAARKSTFDGYPLAYGGGVSGSVAISRARHLDTTAAKEASAAAADVVLEKDQERRHGMQKKRMRSVDEWRENGNDVETAEHGKYGVYIGRRGDRGGGSVRLDDLTNEGASSINHVEKVQSEHNRGIESPHDVQKGRREGEDYFQRDTQGDGDDSDDDDDDDPDDLLIGNVHYGFCEYYQSVVAEGLADRMITLAEDYPDFLFFVTGHSLGAAAAAICAADLTQRLGVVSERVVLYTLGEPRTGDGVFAEGLNDHVGTAYRVVHHKDVVPHLSLCCHGWLGKCQPAEASCPYQHCSEVLYDNDMAPGSQWKVCNGTIGEDYACDPQSIDLSVSDHTHYFEMTVGTWCSSDPLKIPPFQMMKAQENARWAEYDESMRYEDSDYTQPFDVHYTNLEQDISIPRDELFRDYDKNDIDLENDIGSGGGGWRNAEDTSIATS